MKEEFKKVHNKLDVISAEFQEVKDAIDWNSVTVSYGDYERRILAAEANLNQTYEREGAAREQQKEHFIRQFDYHFGNSLQSLYDATMRENLLFSPNILDAVVTQTRNHKKKFEQFSLGLVQLLIQGLMVRISYHAMKGEETEDLVEHWNANMIRLKQKLRKTSDEIKNAYLDQLKSDVPDIIRRSPELDNRELRNKIYQFLNEKYDWRYFFVAVYDDYTGDDKHYVSVCGGDTFRTPNEKNVVVASQDKSLEARNHRSFARWSLVLGVAQNAKSCGRGNFDSQTSARRSKVLVENLMALSDSKCSPNQLYMAVEIHDEFHSSNPNGHRDMRRITQKRLCNCRPHFGLYLCDEVYWNHMIIAFG